MPRYVCSTLPLCRACAAALDVDLEADFDEAEVPCGECKTLNIVTCSIDVWYDVNAPKPTPANAINDWDEP